MTVMGYVLAFAIDSDTLIRGSFWVGIGAVILTVLLTGIVILLRVVWINQQRKRRKVEHKWQPILSYASGKKERVAQTKGAIDAPVPSSPKLAQGERIYFLEYFTRVYEKATLEGRERLREIAQHLGMAEFALHLADSDYLWRQLLGIEILGHLKDPAGIKKLKKYVASSDNVVSLTAARALTDADSKEVVPIVMPLIRKRYDWSEPRVAEILMEAGASQIGKPLAELFNGATPEEQVRLIHFSGATRAPEALGAVRALLVEYDPTKHRVQNVPAKDGSVAAHDKEAKKYASQIAVIIAALGVLHNREDHATIVEFLAHPDWRVRETAAAALGRIATKDDEKRLRVLLHDEHWWVRYRAAKALAHVPDGTLDDFQKHMNEEQNPAAQAVLRHVLAEEQLN